MTRRFLDCAPLAPRFPRWHVGETCILIETDQGTVLVDTGLGLGVVNDPGSAAVRWIARLGYGAEDVRQIVMTHLHFDHAGGLPDFPQSQVHVNADVEAMVRPRTWISFCRAER